MLFHTKTHFFVQVAENGSFTSAAKKLFVTPTAVMKQIDLFESELGFQLFERSRRGVHLTSAGESLYHDIKQLHQQGDEAVQRAKAVEQENSYTLRVGTSLLYPCTPLLTCWPKLKQKHPEFRLQLVSIDEDRHNVMQNLSLLGRDFDCIISPLDSITCSSQCQFYQLDSCQFCITLPLSHRLAENASLSYQDLHGERLMLPPRGDHLIFDQVRNQIEKGHPQIRIMEGPLYHDLKLYSQCELTNILLLTTSNTPDIQPSLKSIPLDNGLTVPYGFLYATKPSWITKQFLDILSQN
jgi:DNA-binding transcriptional LysR family regulator